MVATQILYNCHPLWNILHGWTRREVKHHTGCARVSMLLELLFYVLNKTEVSSPLFRGQVSTHFSEDRCPHYKNLSWYPAFQISSWWFSKQIFIMKYPLHAYTHTFTLPATKARQQVIKEKLALATVLFGRQSRSKVSSADTFQQHSAFYDR